MLRKLLLLLILGNLLLWAWTHGMLRPFGLGPQRIGEPQRLHQQLHPGSLVLLGPHGTPASAAASAASAPAAAPTASAAAAPSAQAGSKPVPSASAAPGSASAPASGSSGASTTQAAADPAATCLRIGPYSGQPDAALGAALRAAGFDAQARTEDLPQQWMVLMGPYPDLATQQHKLDELRKLGLPANSFVGVTGRPRYMPGIALGVFDKRDQAQLQLKRMHARGVSTAHVVQRNLGVRRGYWVLPALDAAQAARLSALPALHAANLHAQPCPAG